MFLMFEDVVDVFIMELFLQCFEVRVICWDVVELQVELVELQAQAHNKSVFIFKFFILLGDDIQQLLELIRALRVNDSILIYQVRIGDENSVDIVEYHRMHDVQRDQLLHLQFRQES